MPEKGTPRKPGLFAPLRSEAGWAKLTALSCR